MIFSKLASSAARASRSKGLVYGNSVRSAILSDARIRAAPALEAAVNTMGSGLGFLRRQLASLVARKGVETDLSCVFANPRLRPFFSSEAPKKKNYENYYPKDRKQAPKNEQKSENREGSKKNDNENFGDMFTKEFQNMLIPLIAIGLIVSSFSAGSREQQQASMSN